MTAATFGQLIIGPPGSGKSTYCTGMQEILNNQGRAHGIVNLDPANDSLTYTPVIDIRELVNVERVMNMENLGPNGAMLFALEYVELEWTWLQTKLSQVNDKYLLFDCPGQIELFTHHGALRSIFLKLQRLGYRLTVIQLFDSFVLTQSSLYISSLLLALRSMLQMELPHINVFSKIDNLSKYPPLPFNLDFYTQVHDLRYLIPHVDREPQNFPRCNTASRYTRLTNAIIDLVDDFCLLSFYTLSVQDAQSMVELLNAIDRASGYVLLPAQHANFSEQEYRDPCAPNEHAIWSSAVHEDTLAMDVLDVQERWCNPLTRKDDVSS